eukprot:SAG31_NODE_19422_length_602_cov_1.743539_1_plen_43_part_01
MKSSTTVLCLLQKMYLAEDDLIVVIFDDLRMNTHKLTDTNKTA